MKIIYEQGDIVYNSNNFTYGVVIKEHIDESITILECGGKDVFINSPPKTALKYCGHLDFKKSLRDMILPAVEKRLITEKGGE